ncbi:MAG: lipoate--protein ligase family protein [Chlorobiales bacterium]|nr:lipoate--protein ligase family protein [Chlorobiales bacterium]
MNTFFSKVYCVDTGLHTGEENMEFDRWLMAAFLDGRFQKHYGSESCLWRFYSWRPYAITLGYNQDCSEIDILKCQAAGVDVVRRPTGGRAVFHADEFTYSFFSDSSEQNSVLYRMVHEVIQQALKGLGIHAEFCRSTLQRSQGVPTGGSVSCFTASAKYELQVEGRKLVGSAQRKTMNVLLQHGSLLLSELHKELCQFITFSEKDALEDIRDEMERKSISLEEILGYIPQYEHLAELMRSAAGELHGIKVEELHMDELLNILGDHGHLSQ